MLWCVTADTHRNTYVHCVRTKVMLACVPAAAGLTRALASQTTHLLDNDESDDELDDETGSHHVSLLLGTPSHHLMQSS